MSSPPPVPNAACTALPNGSMIEARVGMDPLADDPRVPGREHDVLGERAVDVDAQDPQVLADVRAAGPARRAAAARDVGLGGDERAGLEVVHLGPDGLDGAGDLVAERHRQPGDPLLSPLVPVVDVQVGPADRRRRARGRAPRPLRASGIGISPARRRRGARSCEGRASSRPWREPIAAYGNPRREGASKPRHPTRRNDHAVEALRCHGALARDCSPLRARTPPRRARRRRNGQRERRHRGPLSERSDQLVLRIDQGGGFVPASTP